MKAVTNLTPLLVRASEAGLRLRADAGDLVAVPRSQLTPKLRSELLAHKPELLEALAWNEAAADALLKDALAYLNEFYVKGGKPDFDLAALHDPEDRINEAFANRDMFALRITVREWVQAGLAAFEAEGKEYRGGI